MLQFRGPQNTALFYSYVLLILSSEQLLELCSRTQGMKTRVIRAARAASHRQSTFRRFPSAIVAMSHTLKRTARGLWYQLH
jgi:hypothetical protein